MFAVSASATQRGILERQRQAEQYRLDQIARMKAQAELDRRMRVLRRSERRRVVCERYRDKLAWARLRKIVAGYYPAPPTPPPTMLDIIERFAWMTGLSAEELKGPPRTDRVSRVRHAAMYWIRRRLGKTTPEIGKAFGGRDHTTVHHGCRMHVERQAAKGRHLRPVVGCSPITRGGIA